MSYTPKTWHTGDTVTATDLNNIENGIANSSPWDAVIRLMHTNDSGPDAPANLTLSIVSGTFAQLYAKINNGGCPCILVEYYHPSWGILHASPIAYIIYSSSQGLTICIAGYSRVNNQFGVIGELAWTSNDTLGWT